MNKQKTTKKQETPAPKQPKNFSWLYTMITVIVGVACAVLILGLATRGLETYIKGMTDNARTSAAIVGVSLMAFGVASLVKLAKR